MRVHVVSSSDDALDEQNPVLDGAKFVYKNTHLAQINEEGTKAAAQTISTLLRTTCYTPRTWRTQPLHLLPPDSSSSQLGPFHDTLAKPTLDWIFLVSALNFSFWSEYEGKNQRYSVEWREGWGEGNERAKTWNGYWSLLAALNRALEEGIPITDPSFYSDLTKCPDELIEHIFRAASCSIESIPLLKDRIRVMREVGSILCERFNGSYQGFLAAFDEKYGENRTALQAVQMVVDTFPSFRDEVTFRNQKVPFWKRPQILIAETWAAFYPPSKATPHPIFPHGTHQITMFADYRVPQILEYLGILSYTPDLKQLLNTHTTLAPGSEPEVAIRAASILAVERLRLEVERLQGFDDAPRGKESVKAQEKEKITSVLLDFFLWDLAKEMEEDPTKQMLPAHRTRSIWY